MSVFWGVEESFFGEKRNFGVGGLLDELGAWDGDMAKCGARGL